MKRMLHEIHEEPEVIMKTHSSIKENVNELINIMKNKKRIFVTGDGSSYHASLVFSYLLKKYFNIYSIPASELKYHIPPNLSDDLLIIFSQSGENKDALNAFKNWKIKGGSIVSITNNDQSYLHKNSDFSIYLNAGEEIAIPATKSYISQIYVSIFLYNRLLGKNSKDFSQKISFSIKKIFDSEIKIKEISNTVQDKIVLLGSYLLYITAMEGSLKITECSSKLTVFYYLKEYFHGPVQSIDADTTIIILGGYDHKLEKRIVKKLKDYGAQVLYFSFYRDADIYLGKVNKYLYPIISIVPIQLLAYYIAERNGIDPDNPDKLKKVLR